MASSVRQVGACNHRPREAGAARHRKRLPSDTQAIDQGSKQHHQCSIFPLLAHVCPVSLAAGLRVEGSVASTSSLRRCQRQTLPRAILLGYSIAVVAVVTADSSKEKHRQTNHSHTFGKVHPVQRAGATPLWLPAPTPGGALVAPNAPINGAVLRSWFGDTLCFWACCLWESLPVIPCYVPPCAPLAAEPCCQVPDSLQG